MLTRTGTCTIPRRHPARLWWLLNQPIYPTETMAVVERGKPCGNKHVAAPSKQQSSNNQPFICFNHCHWRKEAWECANSKNCKFEGNGKARGH